MATTATLIRAYVRSLNEWQKECNNSNIRFSTKKVDGKYIVVRRYLNGTVQMSDPKSEMEIVPFLKEFWKRYCLTSK